MLRHDDPSSASARDKDGKTALIHAAWSGSLYASEKVSLLLQYGPNVASAREDKSEDTVLMYAARSDSPRSLEIVNLLLEHDAIDSHFNKDGTTCFIRIVNKLCTLNSRNKIDLNLKLIEIFLKKCSYTAMVSSAGYSALDHMIINSSVHKTHLQQCNRGLTLLNALSKCS